MNKKMKVAAVNLAIVGAPMAAMATEPTGVDLTGVSLDTTTVTTLAGTILGGLGVLWGIRKVIKTINRS